LSGVAGADCDLHGLGVLVTRPPDQAAELCALIDAHGGRALSFPTLTIQLPSAPERAGRLLCGPADLFVFISPNAVTYARRLLAGRALTSGARIAAVGSATAKALLEAGFRVDLQPRERFDSEGLLALPDLASLHGQRVVIVRGEGGRALLGDTLQARGADLDYAEVYRRGRPDSDPTALLAQWRQRVDLVSATSAEILSNLVAMLGRPGWPLLGSTPLLVISERMREQAQTMGFARLLVAQNAGSQAIVTRLCEWVASGE
jgi:uroporphyrinogen-III synthase